MYSKYTDDNLSKYEFVPSVDIRRERIDIRSGYFIQITYFYTCMGIDLRVITGHRLSAKQVMDFPDWLEKQQQLKDVFIEHSASKLYFGYKRADILSGLEKKSTWENYTEADLLESWENNEDPERVDETGFIQVSLVTYFGFIYFNRETIEVMYFPEHKYSNLTEVPQRSYILNFSKALAQAFGQTQIVYCSDTYETEYIETLASEGKNLETIIKLGIERFGSPPKTIEAAIVNRFFIDDLHNPLK
ncbi:hypothetical protein [Fluviicola chungangensis]|uniref:Uncharacterized protein n=1 Tax=Fluviicola chungangensis TaxID=2597671 RepID=A0A556N6V5_9FLAO|nr:hypothetical protein [Fluviicola chungangensis]TSJ47813.1 hypothetical protein FO442_01410 [Fluviicola chungangensis]